MDAELRGGGIREEGILSKNVRYKINSHQFQDFERGFERVFAPLGAVVVVLLHRPEHVSDDRQNVGVQFAENAKEDSNPGQAKLAFSGARK